MRTKFLPLVGILLNFLIFLTLSQCAVGPVSLTSGMALSDLNHLSGNNPSSLVAEEIMASSVTNLVEVEIMGVLDSPPESSDDIQPQNTWGWLNLSSDSSLGRLARTDKLNAPASTSFVVEYESPANSIRLYDAVQTLDGGFIAVGEISTSTYKKAWIVKTSELGEIQWQKSYTLSRDGSAKSVHLKGSGYIVAGEYYYSGDGYHITVTNLDQDGNVIWSKRIIRKTENSTFSFEPTHDGGYIIALERYLFNFPPITTLVKIDSLGEVVWAKDPPATYLKQAVPLDQGGYAAVGTYGNDTWVARLDESGNVIWQKTYSYPNDRPSWGDVISATDDGGMIIGSGVHIASTFAVSMIIKLDVNGHVEWTKYILPGGNVLTDIEQTADGYFLSGYVPTLDSRDVWLIKLGLSGEELWQRLYGRDSHSEMGMSVTATTDGGALIGGNISDTTTRGLLLKTDSGGNLVGCSIQKEEGFSLGAPSVTENTLSGGYYSAYPVYAEVYANNTGNAYATENPICSDMGEPCLQNISGKITDGHSHPLANVFVALIDDIALQRTTTTDNEGSYTFNGVPSQTNYTIRVLLRDNNEMKRILYGDLGLAVMATTEPLYFSRCSADGMIMNVDFGDPTLAASVPSEKLDDLAAIYYHATQVDDFVMNELGFSDYQPVRSIWGFAPEIEGARYLFASQSIEIGEGISDYAIDSNQNNRPMNREWHESFHHVMTETIGIPPSVLEGIEPNHGGFDNASTADSWTEGWAEFWPCVLWDKLGYPNPQLYRNWGTTISLEYNWKTWDRVGDPQTGLSREEYAAASLLWDLYDPKAQNDNDNIDLGLDSLWNVISQEFINDLTDIRDVYEALIQTPLLNEDGTPVDIDDIDSLFIEHGFYADGVIDDNNVWEPGEEAGWGGKPERRSTVTVDNAYIKVNVENENGNPVDGASLLINVSFENSYYDYSYIVDLGSGSGNMVYLELPPSRTYTIANVTAIHQGGQSESHMIENATYWENVINSTVGYAEEYTFVVDYKAYLPVVVTD